VQLEEQMMEKNEIVWDNKKHYGDEAKKKKNH
jgi:hypothetical protein